MSNEYFSHLRLICGCYSFKRRAKAVLTSSCDPFPGTSGGRAEQGGLKEARPPQPSGERLPVTGCSKGSRAVRWRHAPPRWRKQTTHVSYLTAGAVCLLAGMVGRYAKEGWSLFSRLPPLLLAVIITLGGLLPAAAVCALAVRAHEKASALLSAGLPELTAEYHTRAPVLSKMGVFCLLAGVAFIAYILLSIQGSRAGGTS